MGSFHHYAELMFTWIGFGVVSGLVAKAILPGRDPGGTIVTAILGLAGAIIGAALYAWAGGDLRIRNLISPIGFGVSVAGAILLLLTHRLFSGRIFDLTDEGEDPIDPSPHLRRRRRARQYEAH